VSRGDWAGQDILADPTELESLGTQSLPLDDILGSDDFDQAFGMFSLFVTGTRRINECWSAQAAVGYTAKRAEHRHRRPPVAARAVATKRSGPEVRRRNDPWPDRWILWLGVGLHHVREHGHRTGNLDRGAYSGIVGAESEPLPSILLLEDRLGIRFHEAAESPRWSIEWTARVVAAQRRVANSLLEVPSSGFTVCDVRGYWRVSDRLLATAGIENFTNANHREHLNFTSQDRLVQVFQPGWNAYAGAELTY
jgi:hypothetical protein